MKKALIWILISAVVMFVLPLLTVLFAGDSGMAICFILFYAVNPVFSALIGVVSGKRVKNLWFLPIINALLFLLSTWVLFDMGEIAFVMYAGVYLLIGLIAMVVSSVVYKKIK